ncbi:hypothetical protein ETAA8_17750 [Anatilimnocola aggregata]|uniref:Uncharacterized protein n=1 Tax=Anatilimnocola aggregata TaxID=2528021 RepID=A0A517Y8Y0_9BACT|nr:hypothetical protein ETAA8_17750 [Anatilimnocola aggregata]
MTHGGTSALPSIGAKRKIQGCPAHLAGDNSGIKRSRRIH